MQIIFEIKDKTLATHIITTALGADPGVHLLGVVHDDPDTRPDYEKTGIEIVRDRMQSIYPHAVSAATVAVWLHDAGQDGDGGANSRLRDMVLCKLAERIETPDGPLGLWRMTIAGVLSKGYIPLQRLIPSEPS